MKRLLLFLAVPLLAISGLAQSAGEQVREYELKYLGTGPELLRHLRDVFKSADADAHVALMVSRNAITLTARAETHDFAEKYLRSVDRPARQFDAKVYATHSSLKHPDGAIPAGAQLLAQTDLVEGRASTVQVRNGNNAMDLTLSPVSGSDDESLTEFNLSARRGDEHDQRNGVTDRAILVIRNVSFQGVPIDLWAEVTSLAGPDRPTHSPTPAQ